jgi:hypothetical protein
MGNLLCFQTSCFFCKHFLDAIGPIGNMTWPLARYSGPVALLLFVVHQAHK